MACALPNFYSTAHLMTTCGDGQANDEPGAAALTILDLDGPAALGDETVD